MLSDVRRQAKLAKKAKVRKQKAKQRAAEQTRLARGGRDREDYYRLINDKREELYGQGDAEGGYLPDQVAHVDAIVNAYTPEERAAALALANALTWESGTTGDEDYSELRMQQRRQQGRGLADPA